MVQFTLFRAEGAVAGDFPPLAQLQPPHTHPQALLCTLCSIFPPVITMASDPLFICLYQVTIVIIACN